MILIYSRKEKKKHYSCAITRLVKAVCCQVGTLENLAPAFCLSKGPWTDKLAESQPRLLSSTWPLAQPQQLYVYN